MRMSRNSHQNIRNMLEEQTQLFDDPDKTYNVYVYLNRDPEYKILSLRKSQLRSLRSLKKRVLNLFNFQQSQGDSIMLNIMQAYPNQPQHLKTPIASDINLKTVIEFLICYQRDIKILMQSKRQLKQKDIITQQALDNHQIHFDENGSLIEETDMMGQNIPADFKYNNHVGNVRCQFCQKNNKDVNYLKRCGGLYGPYRQDLQAQTQVKAQVGRGGYVHLLCGLWCHKVYLNNHGKLRNVAKQVKRAEKAKCYYCKETGAGLICVGRRQIRNGKIINCNRKYHFKCAYDSNCKMNWTTFKMHCKDCLYQEQQEEQQHQKNELYNQYSQQKKQSGQKYRQMNISDQ